MAMNYDDEDFDFSKFDFGGTPEAPCIITNNCTEFFEDPGIGERHLFALICYGIVFLLGVPGNGLVVWVTAFKMPRSVNAVWFLNLAVADLLCCLSLPLQMVPLAMDKHWPYGEAGCKIIGGLFYMLMYCSVLLLTLISVDRWLLVSKPAWCQNWRHPRLTHWVCVCIWVLALLGSIPQFIYVTLDNKSANKAICVGKYSGLRPALTIVASRFLLGFLLPFLIICISHWTVYRRANRSVVRRQNERSARTLRVIIAVVFSFVICWIPLHIVEMVQLLSTNHDTEANLNLAHVMALCLAYFNSCLNPLLYVCLGRGFRENMTKSLRSVFHFSSEEHTRGPSLSLNTKSTTESNILARKSIK